MKERLKKILLIPLMPFIILIALVVNKLKKYSWYKKLYLSIEIIYDKLQTNKTNRDGQ